MAAATMTPALGAEAASKDQFDLTTAEVAEIMEQPFTMPKFDPSIHLAFTPPTARHSFTELGLPKPTNAPDICFTEPFQLFSQEGVRMLRREVFRKEFLDKYLRSWERAPCYISGHTNHPGEASFIKQAWYHPATQAAINYAFGCALKPLPKESDVGYVNVMLGKEGIPGVYKMNEFPAEPLPPSRLSEIEKSEYDDIPIDAWHKDMVPVVCVLMLSDTSTMEGGETAIRTGDGSILKARGANIGGCVLMQGGLTEHSALRATNAAERVSMVTSYGFADPDADDSSMSLKSCDPVHDDMPELMNTFLEYKLERLRDRCQSAINKIRQNKGNGQLMTRDDIEPWVKEQITFLKHSSWELCERIPNYRHMDIPEGALQSYLNDV
ncbi:hypothetical protein AAFC00_005768 [Neodothiora populina]